MKKILVNLPTLQHEKIIFAWLIIFKRFQSAGWEIHVNTGVFVKKLPLLDDIYDFDWLTKEEREQLEKGKTASKPGFILHSLLRNLAIIGKSGSILKNNPDMIYTPSAVLDFVIYPWYLKLTGKKIKWVTTLANTVPVTDPGNKTLRFLAWLFFRISLFMLKKADVVFVHTPEVMDYAIKWGFDKDRLVLAGVGIETDLIWEAQADPRRDIDALFIGRINETKGIYDMLKVLDIVKKKYPCFQLAIMGEGDEVTERNYKKKIKEMRLENNVQFLGYVSGAEKFNIIKSSKCFWFLSVSQSESFGIALLEAVSCGRPAFTYDLPHFSWIYTAGEIDASPKGDYGAVAQKVIRLFDGGIFENKEGKKLLGKYTWEEAAEKEYEVIEKL